MLINRYLIPIIFLFIPLAALKGVPERNKQPQLISHYQARESLILKTHEGYIRLAAANSNTIHLSFSVDSIFQPTSDAVIFTEKNETLLVREETDAIRSRIGNTDVTINN